MSVRWSIGDSPCVNILYDVRECTYVDSNFALVLIDIVYDSLRGRGD